MRWVTVLATGLIVLGSTVRAQETNQTSILKGECDVESHVAEGAIGDDLTKRQSRFFCDSMVITVFGQNRFPKHVMFQFVETKATHSRQIGYAGQMNDENILEISNVYLEEGHPSKASAGGCKLFYNNGALSNVACGAKIDEGDRRTVPVVVFNTALPNANSMIGTTPPAAQKSTPTPQLVWPTPTPGTPSLATQEPRKPPREPTSEIQWDHNKVVEKAKLDHAVAEISICTRDASMAAVRLGERSRERLGSTVASLCKAQLTLIFMAAKAVGMTPDAQQRLALSLVNDAMDRVLQSGQ